MHSIVIAKTDSLELVSHGNGWAYTFSHTDGRSVWFQDDDATIFRGYLEAQENAFPHENALPYLWNEYESVAVRAPSQHL